MTQTTLKDWPLKLRTDKVEDGSVPIDLQRGDAYGNHLHIAEAVWQMEDDAAAGRNSPEMEEFATRLVACWNACQGIDTKELVDRGVTPKADAAIGFNETLVVTGSSEAIHVVERIATQRDDLLAALRGIKRDLMHHRRFGVDTLAGWRNAAVYAEGDAEEALKVKK